MDTETVIEDVQGNDSRNDKDEILMKMTFAPRQEQEKHGSIKEKKNTIHENAPHILAGSVRPVLHTEDSVPENA